jgi:hypothetical protein
LRACPRSLEWNLIRGRAARWPATYLLKEEHRIADSLKSNLTRRTFLKGAGVATAAAVGLTIIVRSARAKSDTLKIGQWTHFLPWVAPISLGTIGWKWMLDSLYSPVNWVLQALHIVGKDTGPCGSASEISRWRR